MSLLVLRSSIAPAPPSFSLSSSSSSSTLAVSANPSSRLDNRFFSLNSKLFNGLATHTPLMVKERCSMILKASADVNGTDSDTPEASSDSEDENLPLESKLQLKLEHKMKMKLAKKIRLRRKKLVRKRGLRKMGRWPPSKMKKNKNV